MAFTPLNRFPSDKQSIERWYTDLVAKVNGLLTMIIADGQIQFPATQNPSTDPNVLDDYEEGTWTLTDASGAGLALTTPAFGTNTYTKIGRLVHVTGSATYPATASGATAKIGGLPFTSANTFCPMAGFSSESTIVGYQVDPSATTLHPVVSPASFTTNAALSGDDVYFSGSYVAAA